MLAKRKNGGRYEIQNKNKKNGDRNKIGVKIKNKLKKYR